MIVMNGLPGAMGKEVAGACLRRGFQLAPVALTGADFGGTSVEVVAEPTDPASTKYGPPVSVSLVDGNDAAAKEAAAVDIKKAAEEAGCAGNVVCIDYTHPSAVNGNAEWYAANDFAVSGFASVYFLNLSGLAHPEEGCKNWQPKAPWMECLCSLWPVSNNN